VALVGSVGGLDLSLQRVHDTSRIHIDIETDNVEAEGQRLEQLGARREARIETWGVMEDPCGHLFCIVPQSSRDFLAQASVWEASYRLRQAEYGVIGVLSNYCLVASCMSSPSILLMAAAA